MHEQKGVIVKDSRILILGITFKENCPDIRNTKIVDIYHTLLEYTSNIVIYDSWADACHVKKEYNIMITDKKYEDLYHQFDAVILGVAHNEFKIKILEHFLKIL